MFTFAARPINNTLEIITLPNFGQSVTMQCPFRLGAITESYDILWSFASAPIRHGVVRVIDNQWSSLTIANVDRGKLGSYVCTVSVTSPYDGQTWSRDGIFRVGKLSLVFKMGKEYYRENLKVIYSDENRPSIFIEACASMVVIGERIERTLL